MLTGHRFFKVCLLTKNIFTTLSSFPQLTERAWSGHKSERALRPGSREVPPRPGRTKCELYETLQFLIMGAGKETSINLPCLLILASSWTVSPSHSYSSELQAKGGHCAARTSCLLMGFVIGRNGSPGVAPPNVPVSGPSTSCLSNDLPRGGGREEGRVRRIGNSPGDFGPSWTELKEVGFQGERTLHNSVKEYPHDGRWMRNAWRRAPWGRGWGTRSRREGVKFHRQQPKRTHKNL